MVLSQKIKQVRVTGHESQERRYSLWRFLPLFYFLFLGLPPPTLESSLGGIIEQRATSRHIEERNDFSKFPNWHSKRSVRHERRSCAISDTITRRSNGGPSTAQVGRQQKKKKTFAQFPLFFLFCLPAFKNRSSHRAQAACRSLSEMLVVCARRGKKMDNEIGWRCTQTHAQQAERWVES